jgi:hypothetical protein
MHGDNDLTFSSIEECVVSRLHSHSLRSTPSTTTLDELDQALENPLNKDDNVVIAVSEGGKSPWSTLEYDLSLSNDYFSKSTKTVVKTCEVEISPEITSSDRPVVAVIGTGYVGYNLVTIFGAHYEVLAFDVSQKRIDEISKELRHSPLITCTANPNDLSRATHFLIAVPTQILPSKKIDTSCVESALSTIDRHARPGATVVIESSVAVGMTRQLLEPLMRSRGLKAGMSPEVCLIFTSRDRDN